MTTTRTTTPPSISTATDTTAQMNKKPLFIGLAALLLLLTLAGYVVPKLLLFNDRLVNWNFGHMEWIFPYRTITDGNPANVLPRQYTDIGETFNFMGKETSLDTFFEKTRTNGLLIIKNNQVVFEHYLNGYDADSRFTSYSVAKSMVGTLVGIAVKEGVIRSLDDSLQTYSAVLKGTPMGKATIQEVLNMSSGVAFSERYEDKSSDVIKIFDEMFLLFRGIESVAAGFDRESSDTRKFHYASINTQYLSMVLEGAYGKDLNEILARHMLTEDRMKRPVSILADMHRQALGFWGVNATLEDFGKFGIFMRDEVKQPQRLSPAWIEQTRNPTESIRQAPAIYGDWGYSNHWWLPKESTGDFSAIGIWGQFVYINPEENVVIVKASADRQFKAHEFATIEVFRQMVDRL